MKDKRIENSVDKIKRKKFITKIMKLALLIIIALVLVSYAVMSIVYNSGNFSITLDRNTFREKGLVIYSDPEYKVYQSELLADSPESFDNISYQWLPADLHEYEGGDGTHNGRNYMAYTFYIENIGSEVVDYWTEVIVYDVIRNVDEAARLRVYKDGEFITYAKIGNDGEPERETVPFENDETVVREHVENFAPGDISKYTVVMWLEGSDPECTDSILGGEIKFQMNFISELTENQ